MHKGKALSRLTSLRAITTGASLAGWYTEHAWPTVGDPHGGGR